MTDTDIDERYLKFAEDTLIGCFFKLARVNLNTGEFSFVMRAKDFEDDVHADSPDIYTYIRRQVEDGTVYPDHAIGYLNYSDPEYVKRQLKDRKRAVINYRRKVGDSFKWVTFSVMSPEDLSEENPYVLFSWREAESSATTMYDAISTLSVFYHKILRINLTTDRYEILKADDDQKPPETISGWFKQFVERGLVHEEDVSAFEDFTDLQRLREEFKTEPSRRSIRYRRMSPQGFRWAQMYLFPSVEFTADNMVLTLYVRDVHDEHISELRNREKLYELYSRDALTLLYNRIKYQKDLLLANTTDAERMTVVYIDLNGLHEVNNLLGHDAGDQMLCMVADALKKYFPDDRCYRIGGDEFVVISYRLSQSTVERIMEDVKRDLLVDKYEISAGVATGDPKNNERIIGEAELKMREDKAQYYMRHGDRRKRNQLNDELEKILTQKKDEEYFLKLISKRFSGVYFVDLLTGGVRHIYVPKYFTDLLEQNDYSYRRAMGQYMRRYVKPEYYPKFEEVLDFDKLIKKLDAHGTASFEYEKVDGMIIHLHILSQDDLPIDQKGSVWIFEEGAMGDYDKAFSVPDTEKNLGWK